MNNQFGGGGNNQQGNNNRHSKNQGAYQQGNQDNQKNQFEDENQDLTAFEKFEKETKMAVFNVLYVLLKDDETKAWKIVVSGLCDFFQIFQFTFLAAANFPWDSAEVENYFNSFLDVFQIAVWLGRLDLTSYIIVIYASIIIVLLIILDIFYVSYSFSRKKFRYVWPLQALRSSVGLFVTVLFLPFLESFTSMLYCVQLNGQYVHHLFPELVCWQGAHIIHAAFCIGVSIVFIVICIIVSLTYFDNNITSSSPEAKVNQRADCFDIVLKIILNYLYTFFGSQDYHWLLIIVLLLLSFQAYRNFRVAWPFFDDRITKFFCCLTGTFFWGNIVLLLIKIIEGTDFNGGYQLYFLGLPLVLAIIILSPDERKKLLLKNINNFEKDDDVALQIRYFLRLIMNKDIERGYNVILKGYIYHHEDFCPNPDCLLKRYKSDFGKSAEEWKLDKKRDMTKFHESLHQVLIQHAKSMYRSAIARFPDSPTLKIQYALFLIEMMENKKDAIIQLKLAEQQAPAFDEQFVIFRLTKQIEDSQDDVTDGSSAGMDIIAKLAFESTLRQIQDEISKSARYHWEFWCQLRAERPDISKLNDLGSKINNSVKIIDDQWQYLQKVNANSPRALRIYAKFLMHILNDKDRGMDFLIRAKEAKQNFFDGHQDDMLDYDSLQSSGSPFAIIDGEPANLGQVIQGSIGLAKLFGFDLQEILKHNIDKIMPDMYAKNHQKILEKANGADPEAVNSKERFVFGKHKSGYVFPCLIQIKAIRNPKTGYQFIAMFKIDKKQFSSFQGYVLVGRDKKICGLTSSCIHLIDMDLKKLQKINQNGYDLQRIAPEVFDNEINTLKNIEWRLPDLKRKSLEDSKKRQSQGLLAFESEKNIGEGENKNGTLRSGNQNQNAPLNKQSTLTVKSHFHSKYQAKSSFYRDENFPYYSKFLSSSLSSITMGEYGEIGWYVKIIQSDEQNRLNQDKVRVKKDLKKEFAQPLFQFNYDAQTGKYIRELVERVDESAEKNMNRIYYMIEQNGIYQDNGAEESRSQSRRYANEDDSQLRNEEIKLGFDEDASLMKSQLEQNIYNVYGNIDMMAQKRKWGKGIHIYKLVSGKFYPKDYDEDVKKQQEAEEERKRQIEEEERALQLIDDIGPNDIQSAQKTRKALQIAFNDKSTPRAISNLRIGTNVVILCFLILSITEYTFNNTQFSDIDSNFNLIRMSYGRIAEIQRIAYDVRTLININEKKQQVYANYTTATDFITYLRNDIEDAMNSLYQLHGNITLNSLPLSSRQEKLTRQETVTLYFRESISDPPTNLLYSLHEAVLEVASAVFTVRHMNFSSFVDGQSDVFFVIYNSYNDFLQALQISSLYYMEDLLDRVVAKQTLVIIIFVISVLVVIAALVLMLPMIFNVNTVRIKVLSLFIDIPQNSVEDLANRCEAFIFKDDEEQPDEEIETVDQQQQQYIEQQDKDQSKINLNANVQGGEDGKDPKKLQVQSGQQKPQRKRQSSKIPKNAARSYTSLYLRFAFAALFLIGYFVGMFLVSILYLQSINQEAYQINIQVQVEYLMALAQNVQRELIYNTTMPVLNKNSFDVARDSLETVQKLSERNRVELLKSDSGSYQSSFFDLYTSNLCNEDFIDYTLIPQQCGALFNNATLNGYQLVLSRYIEKLKDNFKAYITARDSSTNLLQLQQQMFNSNNFLELYLMQFRFIQSSNRYLVSVLQQQETDDYQLKLEIRMILFICFLVATALFYVAVWLPYVNSLNIQIWRTRSMLTIIPLDVIVQMPRIKEFLNSENFFSKKSKK